MNAACRFRKVVKDAVKDGIPCRTGMILPLCRNRRGLIIE